MKRKVLAWVLTAALILTLLPATAFAADSNTDGYNDHDFNKIQSFLETTYDGVKNGDRINSLDYNKDNPTTWAVKWNSEGGELCAYRLNWSSKGIGGALDLSGCTHLGLLYVDGNQLTSLDVSNGMTAAGSQIECQGNGTGFTALNVSGCSGLENLDCDTNGLSTLDLGSLTGLKVLSAYSNKLGTLDITKNTNLTYLDCKTNQLTSLDVTKNTELAYLFCNANQLKSLDVTKNTKLTSLYCSTNQLKSLDVTKNIKLDTLYCAGNQLAALNITNCPDLWDFDCSSNQLKALDISKNTNLSNITLDNNRLSALDVTQNPEIWSFTCASNPLTDIKANFSSADIQLNAGYGGYIELYLDADVDGNVNNDTITVTAKPISGAALINWTNADKSQASTDTSYSLSHGGTYQLTANFLALQSSVVSGKLYVGDKVTLTPNVSGGTWTFDSSYFKRDGNTFTALKAGKETIHYVLNGIHTVYAAEVSSLSNISASANNAAYGSVTGAGGYKPNATATLHATAKKGCRFIRWTENGVAVSTNANYSFKVTKDRKLVAVFAKDMGISCTKNNVTKYGGSDGSITVKASGGNSGAYQYSINNGAAWQTSAKFTGLKAGKYTARARDAKNTANVSPAVTVTISQPNPTAYFANKLPAKASAGTVWLIKPAAPPKGYKLKSVSFASGTKSVATANASGIVKFLKGGKVKLTVKMVYLKGTKTKTIKVVKQITVNQKITSIALNKTIAGIKLKKTLKLTPKFYPASATNKKVTWKSSNSKVATVSAAGVVKGKAKGTAVITCTAKDGSNVSAKCTVTVK